MYRGGMLAAVVMAAAVGGVAADCNVATKMDCGFDGITQQQCEAKGCCWQPVNPNPSNEPWCFRTSDFKCDVNLNGTGPGFTADFYNTMMGKYASQLDVQGCGAVVAAPDTNTPGGSYVYHWMRDGALSMWTYMTVNNNSYSAVKDKMTAYQGWVQKVQNAQDPNVNVLVEPKFNIPEGTPYTGGWCRPQSDGPGLRANAMVAWANILLKNNQEGQVKSVVYPLIQKDLAWVVGNWQSNGCDLWEEVRSSDFFWNRMGFVYSLRQAAALATTLGDSSSASTYSSTAGSIHDSLSAHWSGGYLFEASNRRIDGAVIHAITSFGGGDSDYGPLSSKVAATLTVYNMQFCTQFPINQADTGKGIPGVMIGRYPGDSYAGGNPWPLLTAIHAQLYYKAGKSMRALEAQRGGAFALAANEHVAWKEHLGLDRKVSSSAFVAATMGAGDAIMTRLWSHVKGDGGRIDEQINKNTGTQTSAQSLTWSYANILSTLHLRNSLQ